MSREFACFKKNTSLMTTLSSSGGSPKTQSKARPATAGKTTSAKTATKTRLSKSNRNLSDKENNTNE